MIGTSASEVLSLNAHMPKALAKDSGSSRTNFALALLALAELTSTTSETMKALQIDIGMQYLIQLVNQPSIRAGATLLAEAVRQNKTYAEVTSAQVAKIAPPLKRLDTPTQADSEQQAKTGYLSGAPQAASGGLSTFTVDNSTGERDAVVRLYLDGRKPAARSVYIKLGEKFVSKSLIPGTYTMRYRFIGSTDTFEAENPFELSESKTETGRRFSSVTVTLYEVRDGNMKSKKVSCEPSNNSMRVAGSYS